MRFCVYSDAIHLLVVGLLLALVCGCQKANYERYKPPTEDARQALGLALESWRQGEKPGRITGISVPVEAVDSVWRSGAKLRQFKILGEIHGDGPRCFSVRLLLDGKAGEQKVRYLVMGIKPLWVFRQEDYNMITHWDCSDMDEHHGSN